MTCLFVPLEILGVDLEAEVLSHLGALFFFFFFAPRSVLIVSYKVINGLDVSTGRLWAWTCSGCFTGQGELLPITETSPRLYFSWCTFVAFSLHQGRGESSLLNGRKNVGFWHLCVLDVFLPVYVKSSEYCEYSIKYITDIMKPTTPECMQKWNSLRTFVKIKSEGSRRRNSGNQDRNNQTSPKHVPVKPF